MDVSIYPPDEIIETTIYLPLSKSLSNRALIMNALTPGIPSLGAVAKCDDTDAMVAALELPLSLISRDPAYPVNVGLAGTAMRFLAAYFASLEGAHVCLDGNDRMRQRPIGPLVDALRQCGADIEYAGQDGFPPLVIRGRRLHGGNVSIDATVSSQFLSALLMVAPTFDNALRLRLQGEISSLPYLRMTMEMMRQRGVDVKLDEGTVTAHPAPYLRYDGEVERDWSAASYWYEISAMSAGWVNLPGLLSQSLQGDSALAGIFEKLGVISEFDTEEVPHGVALNPSPEVHSRLELNLADTPDLAQTLAVTCCMLGVPFRFEGLASLRIKETDRLQALANELAKLSYDLTIEKDSVLSWELSQRHPVQGVAPIDTYGDHRMAMAFAPVGLFVPGIVIRGAECVSKSYPGFWDDLRHAGFQVKDMA